MKYILPRLPYAYDALEPHLDAKTMEIHHTKHHQTYVTKLNEGLEKAPEEKNRPLEDLLANMDRLPESIRTVVRNHGGGHWNHTLYWTLMKPQAGGEAKGEIASAISTHFGSFQTFKEKFSALAAGHFGSGWAWLCSDKSNKLVMKSTPDHVCPITEGLNPLFVIDVWEHAYYLKFQNRRPDFISAFWNVVNWEEVDNRFRNPKAALSLPLAEK